MDKVLTKLEFSGNRVQTKLEFSGNRELISNSRIRKLLDDTVYVLLFYIKCMDLIKIQNQLKYNREHYLSVHVTHEVEWNQYQINQEQEIEDIEVIEEESTCVVL